MKTKNAKAKEPKEPSKEKAAPAPAPAAPQPAPAPATPQQAPAGQVQDLTRAQAPALEKPKGRKPDMNLYLSSQKNEKGFWPKIGVGWRNATGSLSFKFHDGVKLDGKATLFAKDVEREQDRSNERGA